MDDHEEIVLMRPENQLLYSGDTNLAHKSGIYTNKILIATAQEYDSQRFSELASSAGTIIIPGMTYVGAVDLIYNSKDVNCFGSEEPIHFLRSSFGIEPALLGKGIVAPLSVIISQRDKSKFSASVSGLEVDKLLSATFSLESSFEKKYGGDNLTRESKLKPAKAGKYFKGLQFPAHIEHIRLTPEKLSSYYKMLNNTERGLEDGLNIFSLQNLIPAVLVRALKEMTLSPAYEIMNIPGVLRRLNPNEKEKRFIESMRTASKLLYNYVDMEIEYYTAMGLENQFDHWQRYNQLSLERFGIYRQENTELNPNFDFGVINPNQEHTLRLESQLIEYAPFTQTAMIRTIMYYEDQDIPILVSDSKVNAGILNNQNLVQFALEQERSLDDLVEFKEKTKLVTKIE